MLLTFVRDHAIVVTVVHGCIHIIRNQISVCVWQKSMETGIPISAKLRTVLKNTLDKGDQLMKTKYQMASTGTPVRYGGGGL